MGVGLTLVLVVFAAWGVWEMWHQPDPETEPRYPYEPQPRHTPAEPSRALDASYGVGYSVGSVVWQMAGMFKQGFRESKPLTPAPAAPVAVEPTTDLLTTLLSTQPASDAVKVVQPPVQTPEQPEQAAQIMSSKPAIVVPEYIDPSSYEAQNTLEQGAEQAPEQPKTDAGTPAVQEPEQADPEPEQGTEVARIAIAALVDAGKSNAAIRKAIKLREETTIKIANEIRAERAATVKLLEQQQPQPTAKAA